MRHHDYLLRQRGFFNNRERERKLVRKIIRYMVQPYVKKNLTDYDIWSEAGDDDERKLHREVVDENALKLLSKLKGNDITYIKVKDEKKGGYKIIEVINKPKEN